MGEVMYKEPLKFNADGKFRILQVSDAQDMHIPRRGMFKMLNKIYDEVKPDLIVLTGDNILGNHINDALVGKRKAVKTKEGTVKRMKKALGYLLNPIEKRKIPFAFVYGNHDDMNCITKEEQASIYGDYNYCVPYNTTNKNVDCDTYNIPVLASTGNKLAYNIWMIDSAGYDKENDRCFEYVKPQAVDWYRNKSIELEKENGAPVMSLMFQHIPVPQTRELFVLCKQDDKGAVKSKDGNYYRLNQERASGFAFEYPETTSEDFGQLDAIRCRGDVCALVFGHDHTNCFSAEIDGVNIVQTPGASFRSYGNMVSRGVRVFEIDEKDTTTFSTYTLSYFDLYGKNFISVLRYIFNADEYEKIKAVMIALLSVIGVSLIAYIASIFHLFTRFMY